MPDGPHRAVFLDRDGTIVDDPPPGYLHEPGRVHLLRGAAAGIRRLNQAGWLVVTVTNQSGIARGLFDAVAYEAVQRRLGELLAEHDARLDAAYFCPHYPEITGPCGIWSLRARAARAAAAVHPARTAHAATRGSQGHDLGRGDDSRLARTTRRAAHRRKHLRARVEARRYHRTDRHDRSRVGSV